MRLTAAGYLGIGTASPAAPLHVATANTSSYGAFINSAVGTAKVGNGARAGLVDFGVGGALFANWYYTGGADKAAEAGYSPRIDAWISDGSIRFSSSTLAAVDANITWLQRMVITQAGDVGIGTSSPGAKLDIATGAIRVRTGASVSNTQYDWLIGESGTAGFGVKLTTVQGSTSTRHGMAFYTSAAASPAERMRLDEDGNLLIGATSSIASTYRLQVGTVNGSVSTSILSVTDTAMVFRGTPNAVGWEHAKIFGGRDTTINTYASFLAFYTEGKESGTTDTSTEKMRITSAGRVGINTTAPGGLLQVGNANIEDSSGANISSNSAAGGVAGGLNHGKAFSTFNATNSSADAYNQIANTNLKLISNNNAMNFLMGGTINDRIGGIQVGHSSPVFASATGVLTLNPFGGNVGIGTTSPGSRLSVYTALGANLGINHDPGVGTYPRASGIGLGATSTSLTVSSGGGTVSFVGGAGLYAENTASSGNPTNLVFWTNALGTPSEKMRLTAGGQLLVGATGANSDLVGVQNGTGWVERDYFFGSGTQVNISVAGDYSYAFEITVCVVPNTNANGMCEGRWIAGRRDYAGANHVYNSANIIGTGVSFATTQSTSGTRCTYTLTVTNTFDGANNSWMVKVRMYNNSTTLSITA
jgi:hypothetical protein